MINVFTEEIEVTIKDGISNLYWYRGDLYKAFLRSGVDQELASAIHNKKDAEGKNITKRQMMDLLYEELRKKDYNQRLEVSRNFVRILIDQKVFVPQNENHRIEVAERCALKLKEIIRQQEKDREYREQIQRRAQEGKKEDYHSQLIGIREQFISANDLQGPEKGYALEKLFTNLMRISSLPVEEPFRIEGEQIDGAIKYDGHYYLIGLKWVKDKVEPSDIGSFCFKVDGKMKARTDLLRNLKEVFRRYKSQPLSRIVELINPILRGWINYFRIGNSSECFAYVKDWVEKKIRRHLMRVRKRHGFGWNRWSRDWLYNTLGLYNDYKVRYCYA